MNDKPTLSLPDLAQPAAGRPAETQPTRRGTAPIRVGFVMHVMQVAGAEVLVKQIIDRNPHELDATVFCLDDVGELGYQLREQGVPVISFDRREGIDWSVPSRLAREVRDRQIQVLHAHQYTPFFFSALAKMLHRAPAKIIFTEHGRHYPDVVSWKRRWANRLILQRMANVSTACCDFSTHALQQNEGFGKAFTLANGVDTQQAHPAESGAAKMELRKRLELDPQLRYAACIARFHPIKDHETLVRAWKIVSTQTADARLLLVGDGPERSRIEGLCKQLGIGDRVQFLGIRQDVNHILRAIDVFTLSSISEAASLTLLEAMACGIPAVVTDVGGNAEHVREGIEGYLVPRGDSVQLAERLSRLLTNPAEASALGQAARERVVDHFDLDHVIRAYVEIYRDLSR